MKNTLCLILIMLLTLSNVFGQLATYTGSGGASTAVTGYPNETVSVLQYSGFGSNTPCSSGGLSGITVNTSWSTYSISGPIVFIQIVPNTGYQLNVTGFDAGLRSSNTGPTCVRFAYSLDNGTTWIDDGACHPPFIGSCNNTTVSSWSGGALPTGISSTTWGIIVALFPYAPVGSSGTFQINTININGSVVNGCTSPTAISGATSVCSGQTITLSDGSAGGTWSSNNTSVATVSSTGIVTGIIAGSTVITYSTGCGTNATATVTVNPSPATITGSTSVCSGLTITLSDATSGGTWSSNNTTVATVSGLGVVSGVTAGTANISYTVGSCLVGIAITVNTLQPITGATTVCAGSTTALSNTTPGGVWSSDNTAVATISGIGHVTGVAAGTVNISYAVGSCTVGVAVIVSGTLSSITGASGVCPGSMVTLSDATPGGVWSSSISAVATVSGTGVVSGVAVGTANISYTVGSCSVGVAITVNTLLPITGSTGVCAGSTTILSDATSGGVWSSSNTAIATISGIGHVTGIAAGTTNISYTVGSCSVGIAITVTGSLSPITGAAAICPGSTITLSDAMSGGVWSCSNTSVATVSGTGVVAGVAVGTANISYTVGSCAVGIAIAVNILSPVTGAATTLCAGSVITLSDATPGGVWSSSNTSMATVNPIAGIVTGVSAGTPNITYTVGSCTVSIAVTVSGLLSPITGGTGTCSGSTIHLSDATPGGVWSSYNTAVATISGIGVVSGVIAGTANISYTVGTCSTVLTITINTVPPITGSANVCVGTTTTLSDSVPGGVWSSGGITAATVSATGVVTGVASGSATIYYTLGSCSVSTLVTVGFAIAVITGTTTVCTGATIALSDATSGGVWSSSNTSIATLSGTVVHGISAGIATISYTVGGCSASHSVTVNPSNAGIITGKDSVCIGSAHIITLSDNVSGGVWSSTSTSHATVTAATGIVTGVFTGVDTIKYTVSSSCGTFTAKFVLHIRTAAQCATGLNPIAEDQLTELKVFPNPNGGTFSVNLLSSNDEEVRIVITNIIGEKVQEFITTTNKAVNINIERVAGIYLISASSAHGRYFAKVIVD